MRSRWRTAPRSATTACRTAPSTASSSCRLTASATWTRTRGARPRCCFLSWSDGAVRTHMITGQPQGTTLTAALARDRKLVYVPSNPSGHINASPDTASGSYVAEGTAITLTATVDAAGYLWGGWLGDTLSRNTQITLPMNRPYAVRAVFLQPLATADVVAQLLGVATPLNADQLGYLDVFGNANARFDVGDFKAWVDATGAPPCG